jgi:hypothetical protein
MKLDPSVLLLVVSAVVFPAGCGEPPSSGDDLELTERAANEAANCTFSRGVTTCVTTSQRQVQSTHTEVSGCVVGPGSPPTPGRRTRTFADVTLVTETTTTLQHGRHGPVFDTQTDTQTQLLSSTLISDVCEPIG